MAITFVSSSFSGGAPGTNLTPTKPASVVPGDLLLAGFLIDNSAKSVSGSGWNQVRNDTDATKGNQAIIFSRVEDGTALGAFSWDGTSIYRSVIILAYRGARVVQAHSGQVNAAATAVDAPTLTTTEPNCMNVWWGTDDYGGVITLPAGYTDRKLNGFDIQPGEKVLTSAGATGTVSGSHASNRSQGQMTAIAPLLGGALTLLGTG